ncbi:DUF1801 domain-containing protein [Tamlana sp. 2_MG-2023]|uniref:DUF1801 domain-containing protein n=1 Tax=unclassified Tamlana TaxID=2614803 RepID=UPI0026E3D9F1|nr:MULTISPECIES: DUF1801 domain-containing protein [unclassified Tamlana]MDO6760530.1 DUF1801 domain-containing protein [Tamlana sp. 2_MG-2023]MDO6790786.1 DUF1801 domain-containing protein [Tamlana sp. 1_MG-2023]
MLQEVQEYLNNQKKWKKELTTLRDIILTCGLEEGFKWKHPCYTHEEKNVVLIHEFDSYCGMSFFKGVLLDDSEKLLIQQTENMQTARQMRFTDLTEIIELEPIIKQYLKEAIKKSGQKVAMKKTSDYEAPSELEQIFKKNTAFQEAFETLTPGRQRGYLLHFSKAKLSKTKTTRIEKNMQRIFDGYGLNDCTCGLSKRKPNCDGSHKQLES